MAVDISAGSNRSYFTGYAPLRIVAINPTMADLIKMGIPAQTEPVYTRDVPSKNDPNVMVKQTRLEFHYAGAEGSGLPEGFTARNSLFVKYEPVPDFYVNRFNKFASQVKNPQGYAALFENEGAPRLAFDGEMDLMMQLEALCNPRKGKEFKLDTIQQIIYYGAIDEISKILTSAARNTVQGVLGVQTSNGKQYQTVFRRVQPSWSTKLDYVHKALAEHAAYNKDTYYGPLPDLAVRPYNPAADPFAQAAAAAAPAPAAMPAVGAVPAPPAFGGMPAVPPAPGAAGAPPAHIQSPADKNLPF